MDLSLNIINICYKFWIICEIFATISSVPVEKWLQLSNYTQNNISSTPFLYIINNINIRFFSSILCFTVVWLHYYKGILD